MTENKHPLLNNQDLEKLKTSLNFFHVEELREVAAKLSLPTKSKKGVLIERIVHFLKTGEVRVEAKLPQVSCAERGKTYSLNPDTLILKGAYKNDLATRQFFKKLIGSYFHFTAFGVDWVNERWMTGNSPTYKEFADMWTKEYARRKEEGSHPKHEWAYINLSQQFIKDHPHASKKDILEAWGQARQKNLKIAHQILEGVFKKIH